MKRQYSKLNRAWGLYEEALEEMTAVIQGVADFRVHIFYQPGDGFVVCDEDSNIVPLDTCMALIEAKGRLNHEYYLDNTI